MMTADRDTIFDSEPELDPQGFWNIRLRYLEPNGRTGDELTALLRKTSEWWAVQALGLDRSRVQHWWKRWGTGSQAQVVPVRASILAICRSRSGGSMCRNAERCGTRLGTRSGRSGSVSRRAGRNSRMRQTPRERSWSGWRR